MVSAVGRGAGGGLGPAQAVTPTIAFQCAMACRRCNWVARAEPVRGHPPLRARRQL